PEHDTRKPLGETIDGWAVIHQFILRNKRRRDSRLPKQPRRRALTSVHVDPDNSNETPWMNAFPAGGGENLVADLSGFLLEVPAPGRIDNLADRTVRRLPIEDGPRSRRIRHQYCRIA